MAELVPAWKVLMVLVVRVESLWSMDRHLITRRWRRKVLKMNDLWKYRKKVELQEYVTRVFERCNVYDYGSNR